MKRFIRHYCVDTFALWVISQVAVGLYFEKGLQTLFLAGLAFMAASLLAKPVINILLLPLNLVTFGLFRWVSSAVVLYLVTLVIPGFKLVNFYFQGFSSKWIDIPELTFGGILSFVAFAFLISIISSIIYWIIK